MRSIGWTNMVDGELLKRTMSAKSYPRKSPGRIYQTRSIAQKYGEPVEVFVEDQEES